MLVRRLVVSVGVEGQAPIRAGRVGATSGARTRLGAFGCCVEFLIRVGFGYGIELGELLLVAASAATAMVTAAAICKRRDKSDEHSLESNAT